MISTSLLSKKTKAEIIDEYLKLRENIGEAQSLSQRVHDPQTTEILAKAQEYNPDKITKEIGDLKVAISSELDKMAEKITLASQTLKETREAVKISSEQLQHFKNLGTGAEAIEQLIREYDEMKPKLRVEHELKKQDLELQISQFQRQFEHDKEEQKYQIELKTRRAKDSLSDELALQRKELDDREVLIKAREAEFLELQRRTSNFGQELEKTAKEAGSKTARELEEKFLEQIKIIKRGHEHELDMAKLNFSHLEANHKNQINEVNKLKTELERVRTQFQQITSQIIENSGMIRQEPTSSPKASRDNLTAPLPSEPNSLSGE